MKHIVELIQGDTEKLSTHLSKVMSGDYFDFMLLYYDEITRPEGFKELDRFNYESKDCTDFQNEYEGNVAVEITQWVDKEMNMFLEGFCYFLLDRMEKYPESKLVLTSEKACTAEFLSSLDKFFSKVVITDLGVNVAEKENRVIGFAPQASESNPDEVKKEVRRYV